MVKLSVGQRSGLLRGGLILALLAMVIGLAAGCGSDGTPTVVGTGAPATFPVTANLRTNAGPVASNSSATLSGTSTTGTFTPVVTTVGANGLVQFNNVPPGTYVITANGVLSGPIIVRQSAVNLGIILLGAVGGTTGGNTGVTTAATTGSFQTTASASITTGLTTATTGLTTSPVEGTTIGATGTTNATGSNNATTGPNNGTTGFIPQLPPPNDSAGTIGIFFPSEHFTVSGQLVSNDGSNVGNLAVTLIGGGGGFAGMTDSNGKFSIPNVPSAPYTLIPEGFNQIYDIPVPGQNMGNLGTLPAVLTLNSVSGSVVDQNGNPITGFTIFVSPTFTDFGVKLPGTVQITGNTFSVTNLPSGTYDLTFSGGGILGPVGTQQILPGFSDILGNTNHHIISLVFQTNQTGSDVAGGNGGLGG